METQTIEYKQQPMSNAIEIKKTQIERPDSELISLADKITQEVERGKRSLAIDINSTIVETYWNIGRYIVEFEQGGNAKAKYDTSLLTSLSKILRAKVGRGYSRPNLNNMRKFYLLYPICQTVSNKSISLCQNTSCFYPTKRN